MSLLLNECTNKQDLVFLAPLKFEAIKAKGSIFNAFILKPCITTGTDNQEQTRLLQDRKTLIYRGHVLRESVRESCIYISESNVHLMIHA